MRCRKKRGRARRNTHGGAPERESDERRVRRVLRAASATPTPSADERRKDARGSSVVEKRDATTFAIIRYNETTAITPRRLEHTTFAIHTY